MEIQSTSSIAARNSLQLVAAFYETHTVFNRRLHDRAN
jgi:hypothetical protein